MIFRVHFLGEPTLYFVIGILEGLKLSGRLQAGRLLEGLHLISRSIYILDFAEILPAFVI